MYDGDNFEHVILVYDGLSTFEPGFVEDYPQIEGVSVGGRQGAWTDRDFDGLGIDFKRFCESIW
ncbi:MAG: hypothetical protein ACLU6Y_00435 [Ruminococcus sp.]